MSVSTLTSLIINNIESSVGKDSSTYSPGTPDIANEAIGRGITGFIIPRVVVNITYAGVMPSGSPDPITSDVSRVMGSCLPIMGKTFEEWLASIERSIIGGFMMGTSDFGITPAAPFMPFMPGLFLPKIVVKDAHEGDLEGNPQNAVWTKISEAIVNYINMSGVGLTYPAFTPKSTGVATIYKISVF